MYRTPLFVYNNMHISYRCLFLYYRRRLVSPRRRLSNRINDLKYRKHTLVKNGYNNNNMVIPYTYAAVLVSRALGKLLSSTINYIVFYFHVRKLRSTIYYCARHWNFRFLHYVRRIIIQLYSYYRYIIYGIRTVAGIR